MQLHHVLGPPSAWWLLVALSAVGLLLALLGAGCTTQAKGCLADTDCPGGACVVGQCHPLVGSDLGASDGAPADAPAWSGGDLAGGSIDGGSHDAVAPLCSVNHDGVIERSEEPFIVGLGALFAVNGAGMAVPVAVTPQAGGWDFTAAVQSERKVFDQLLSASGQWWSADFSSASYAERIDDGQALYGVFRVSADKLEMLGVVSDMGGTTKTELTYATPIVVLQFPLMVGSTWTSDSSVSGTASGVPFVAQEHYDFAVDLRGPTAVPAGSFDTLRLRMNYKQTYGLYTTTRITYLHLAECFGTVARIRSQDNEASGNFTMASEYRRLATQ